MRRMTKAAAAAFLIASAVGVSTPAEAATVTPMSYHSGSTGCFNYSWADGNITTTVYYHNTCSYTATLSIWWRTGNTDTLHAVTVAGGVHGHIREPGAIININ